MWLSPETWGTVSAGGGGAGIILLLKYLFDWLRDRRKGNQTTTLAERQQLSKDQHQLYTNLQNAVDEAEKHSRQAREERLACERDRAGLFELIRKMQNELGRFTLRIAQLESALVGAGIAIPIEPPERRKRVAGGD